MTTNEHIYKPLPSFLTIKNSPIHGLGLFATGNIPKGTLLGISHIHSSLLEFKTLDITFAAEEHNVIKLVEGNHLPSYTPFTKNEDLDKRIILTKDNIFPNGMIRTPLGGFINHSENDNCDFVYLNGGLWGVISREDIPKNSEITLNYSLTPCGVIKQA